MNIQQTKADLSVIFANIGMYALFIVYPLIMNNGYHDITITRYTFFCIVAAVCAVICGIYKIFRADTLSLKKLPFSAMNTAFFIFLAFNTVSTVFGEFPAASLYGDAGRHMGFLIYIAFFAAYLWISACYRISERDFEIFSVVFILIFIFSFLQFRGFDIFGLLRTMPFDSRINFLSPLGNINVFSGYVCLMAPLSMYMYIFSAEKKKRIFWAVCSLTGFLSLLIANSDSGYLGMGTAFIILFICSCRKTVFFSRFWLLSSGFFYAAMAFNMLNKLFPGARGLSDLTALVTESAISLTGFVLSVILYFVIKKYKNETIPGAVRIIFISVTAFSIIAVISAMIYFSVYDTTTGLGFIEKFLRFNDSWGTERGFVWTRLMQIFSEANLKNKLFGFGSETISILMISIFKEDMLELGYFSDNAHNEYLNLLMSSGLCGLLSYIAILILAIKSTLKKDSSLISSALLLPIAAWSVQAIVNITQPISTPFIFVFFALTQCRTDNYSLLTNINIKRLFPAKSDFKRKEDDIA